VRLGGRSHLIVLSTTLLLGLAARPARAQSADTALATELFNAGRDLMRDGSYAAACPKLAESARLDAKVGSFARLAECEEKLGKMVAARGYWQQATNLARAQGDPRLAHVEAELARVDKVVSKVDVLLDGPTTQGVSLRLDGVEVGAAGVGVALPVDGGSHTIVVSAAGKKPFTTTVATVPDGAVVPVHVPALEDAPVVLPPPRVATPAAAPTPGTWTPVRKVGLATLGVGAAALAVGGVFGILAKVKLDASNNDGCSGNTCPLNGFDERTTARTDGTLSTVFFIAGAAVAAAGGSLLLFAPSKKENPEATSVGLGPASLLVKGTF
jgi:hypothetical protein